MPSAVWLCWPADLGSRIKAGFPWWHSPIHGSSLQLSPSPCSHSVGENLVWQSHRTARKPGSRSPQLGSCVLGYFITEEGRGYKVWISEDGVNPKFAFPSDSCFRGLGCHSIICPFTVSPSSLLFLPLLLLPHHTSHPWVFFHLFPHLVQNS